MAKYNTIEKLLSLNLPDNRLTPIAFSEIRIMPCGDKYPQIKCICTCGKEVEVSLYHFVNNKSKSCGCLMIDEIKKSNTKYPGNVKGIRSSYDSMISRCYSKKQPAYKYYGAKGVKVCAEWRNNYNSFLKWALQNGWQEGLVIDKDKIGTGKLYSPKNCVWITQAENLKYTCRSTVFEYEGEVRTLTEIGRMVGIKGELLHTRIIVHGLSLLKAISKPKYKHSKNHL